jgi:hypothetical protein
MKRNRGENHEYMSGIWTTNWLKKPAQLNDTF